MGRILVSYRETGGRIQERGEQNDIIFQLHL